LGAAGSQGPYTTSSSPLPGPLAAAANAKRTGRDQSPLGADSSSAPAPSSNDGPQRDPQDRDRPAGCYRRSGTVRLEGSVGRPGLAGIVDAPGAPLPGLPAMDSSPPRSSSRPTEPKREPATAGGEDWVARGAPYRTSTSAGSPSRTSPAAALCSLA
jgi:hypothetical protein